MTEDENKEALGQEDIDANLSPPATNNGEDEPVDTGQQQQVSADPIGDDLPPPETASQDDSDDAKETMSQEEINAYIASVSAKEEKENQEKETLQQQPAGVQSDDNASPPDDNHANSHTDCDTLISRGQEDPPPASLAEKKDSAAVSQEDIDTLIGRQQEDGPPVAVAEEKDSSAASQDNIDALIAQNATDNNTNDYSNELSQKEIDDLIVAQQTQDSSESSGPGSPLNHLDEIHVEGKKDAWVKLNQNILSQEEVSALLSGFETDIPDSGHRRGDGAPKNDAEYLGVEGDASTPKNHIDTLIEKEEKYLQKKKRASSLLRDLIQAEKNRIRKLEKRKEKMINDDLYRRFEINRADRSKVVVSMSESNANSYISCRPGFCTHRI